MNSPLGSRVIWSVVSDERIVAKSGTRGTVLASSQILAVISLQGPPCVVHVLGGPERRPAWGISVHKNRVWRSLVLPAVRAAAEVFSLVAQQGYLIAYFLNCPNSIGVLGVHFLDCCWVLSVGFTTVLTP